jgi:hypothetical protein
LPWKKRLSRCSYDRKRKISATSTLSETAPTITEGQMFHSIYYGKNQMPENKKDLTPRRLADCGLYQNFHHTY